MITYREKLILKQIHAGGQVFAIPVQNKNPKMLLKIIRGKDSLFLNIPVSEQETADFTAEYLLPFPAEETILEADDSLLRHLSWKIRGQKSKTTFLYHKKEILSIVLAKDQI